MGFRVDLAERAIRDLRRILEHLAAERSPATDAWFDGLEAAILSLGDFPLRGASATEDRRYRQIFYGSRPHLYRIIYSIDAVGAVVCVLHVRHGARDQFTDGTIPAGDG